VPFADKVFHLEDGRLLESENENETELAGPSSPLESVAAGARGELGPAAKGALKR
jgi:hypothetical protein